MNKARIFAAICFTAAISLLIATGVPAQEKPAAAPAASPIYPIQEGFVDAHGVMIYYKTIGRGARLSSSTEVRAPRMTISCPTCCLSPATTNLFL